LIFYSNSQIKSATKSSNKYLGKNEGREGVFLFFITTSIAVGSHMTYFYFALSFYKKRSTSTNLNQSAIKVVGENFSFLSDC